MRFDAEIDRWEGQGTEYWRTLWQIPELHILEITESTNDDARLLGAAGAPSGTVIIAERQSAGRGQKGRAWFGTAGRSLHFSMLLRADAGFECLGAAPVRVGLLAARAMADAVKLRITLKWPNDLQFEGRKIGGILCESVLDSRLQLVVGIGINVTQQEDDFPPELRSTATSLALASNRVMHRSIVAGALARALGGQGHGIARTFNAVELSELAALDALRGRPVELDGAPAGIASGITAEGCLRVQQDHGMTEFHTGTVRIAELS
jgi:BirA family transcriptional regulator, biotin operon repressor / biotin---[acetyl-CoA-carboxylase] ligase